MYDTLIKANELLLHVEDKNWLIFDCRFDLSDVDKGQKSYAVSHLPGAIYAHLDDHLSSPITPDSGRHPMPDTKKLINCLPPSG